MRTFTLTVTLPNAAHSQTLSWCGRERKRAVSIFANYIRHMAARHGVAACAIDYRVSTGR